MKLYKEIHCDDGQAAQVVSWSWGVWWRLRPSTVVTNPHFKNTTQIYWKRRSRRNFTLHHVTVQMLAQKLGASGVKDIFVAALTKWGRSSKTLLKEIVSRHIETLGYLAVHVDDIASWEFVGTPKPEEFERAWAKYHEIPPPIPKRF